MPEVPWDDPLVQLALTHPSAISEGSGQEDNQRLEFLGDAVLGLAIGQSLFRQLPTDQEGPLSRLRSRLVSREMLAEMGEQLNLAERLQVGHGERLSDPAARQRALTDAFEALIGALFLLWGYLPTQAWVLEVMAEPLEAAVSGLDDGRDPKSMLQEALQHRGTNPVYDVLESIGPAHRRSYRVVVKAAGKVLGRGEGRTKKVAEQDAAKDALAQLAKADLPRRRRLVSKKPESGGAAPLRSAEMQMDQSGAAASVSVAAEKKKVRRRKAASPKPVPGVSASAPSPAPSKRRLVIIHAQDENAASPPLERTSASQQGLSSDGTLLEPVTGAEKKTGPITDAEAAAPSVPSGTSGRRRRRRSRAKAMPVVEAAPAHQAEPVAASTPPASISASAKRRRRRSRRAKSAVASPLVFVPNEPAATGADQAATAAQIAPDASQGTGRRRRHRGGRRRRKGVPSGASGAEDPSAGDSKPS